MNSLILSICEWAQTGTHMLMIMILCAVAAGLYFVPRPWGKVASGILSGLGLLLLLAHLYVSGFTHPDTFDFLSPSQAPSKVVLWLCWGVSLLYPIALMCLLDFGERGKRRLLIRHFAIMQLLFFVGEILFAVVYEHSQGWALLALMTPALIYLVRLLVGKISFQHAALLLPGAMVLFFPLIKAWNSHDAILRSLLGEATYEKVDLAGGYLWIVLAIALFIGAMKLYYKIFPGGIDTGMWWVSSSGSSSDSSSSSGPSTLEKLEKMGREHDKKREEETMKRLGDMSRNGGW